MQERCTNPDHIHFASYGGRGITIDPTWNTFAGFLADMGPRPSGLTLDRRDNDGPYSRENCRWTTRKEQQRNRRDTRRHEFQGQMLTLAEIAEATGINHRTLMDRVNRNGWSIERATTQPTQAPSRAYHFQGQDLTLPQWSAVLGISLSRLWHRIHERGWSIERAFTQPLRKSPTKP